MVNGGPTIAETGVASFTADQERWAEALLVVQMLGERALAHCDERMRDLADDPAGRARWRQIRDRVQQVVRAAGKPSG